MSTGCIRQLFIIWSVVFAPLLWADEDTQLTCARQLSRFVYSVQRGSIGRSEDALKEFQNASPSALHEKENPQGTFSLEDDIVKIFEVLPEGRDLDGFAKKWNLTPDQALDILTYYGTRVFFDSAEIAGEPKDIYSRLQKISRNHFLGDPQSELARRWFFYSTQTTQYSVPQMAKMLGLSEGQVYLDLLRLQISIVNKFGDKLATAREKLQGGESIESVSKELGVGDEALAYALHHTGAHNRGVSWERTLEHNGKPIWETELLVKLHTQHFTHQEIADALNKLAGTTTDDPSYRSAQSVSHKLKEMGLSGTCRKEAPEIYHPDYGLLKENGHLNPLSATQFILAHYQKSDEWLAHELGVTPHSLREFFTRYHIVRQQNGTLKPERSQNTQTRLLRYERQRQALHKFIDWLKEHPSQTPTREDFGTGPGKVGIGQSQFYGTGHYRPGGRSHADRFFDSNEKALLAAKELAQKEGIAFRLYDFPWRGGISDQVRAHIQQETAESFVKWLSEHSGQWPTPSDFQTGPGKLGFTHAQFFGSGRYRAGAAEHATRFFDSTEQALLAIKALAQKKGVPFRLLDFRGKGSIPEEIKPYIQQEALGIFVEWMREHPGEVPVQDDFGAGPGKIGFSQSQFYGVGNYKQSGNLHANRFFDSQAQALTAAKTLAQEKGIPFKLLDFQWQNGIPDAVRPHVQQEALQAFVSWLRDHPGETPTTNNFQFGTGEMGLSQERFYGTGRYKQDGSQFANRIFDSQEQALMAAEELAKKEGLSFRFLDFKWLGGIPDGVRRKIQMETTDAFVSWLQEHPGQLPREKDFGIGAGKVGFGPSQFFGTGYYKVDAVRHANRFFDSRAQALSAAKALAEARGVPWPQNED